MVKISKILEGIIAQTTFDTSKKGIKHSLKDHLMLAILNYEGSLAYKSLEYKLKDWQMYQAKLRITNTLSSIRGGTESAEEFFRNYQKFLIDKYGESSSRVSTLHAIADILSDHSTISSRVFALYGVTWSTIESSMDIDPIQQESISSYIDDIQDINHSKATLLEQFGTDITALAEQGKIDIVVGREKETERIVQILSRRKKNNPVLVGEAGVGKSAIVEGLALKIVNNQVPHTLSGKRIISLDISALVAGTKFRGEFEERLNQLLEELKQSSNTILFIDEIHTIVGAGATQGSLDTANILKPALARGQFMTIGATTLTEYRENIERDAALERRFQKVIVEPATAEETLEIIKQAAPIYEEYHNVKYTDSALKACVELSGRYITDKHFPDKAIDLLDEAGAKAYLKDRVKPEELVNAELSTAQAASERKRALAQSAYNKAVEARLREIALKKRVEELNDSWQVSLRLTPITVDSNDIALTLTTMTGIPAHTISADEKSRLISLERLLSENVIGQDEAVKAVVSAIRRSRAGLRSESRPIAVFMFVGPTGVGKTHLAKMLAQWVGVSSNAMIRLDMSEYSEKHSIARLFGAPPGYVGYGEGGQLTEAVRRRPYSVVLFDEIEKAHPEIFNALLQVFDDGQMTDGEGRKVDFRNTIIIMTSNIGSQAITANKTIGYLTAASQQAEVPKSGYSKALERHFAPEFINRIDQIVFFNRLSGKDVERIVALELSHIISRLQNMGYSISITDSAVSHLATMGYEERYGARSIKRIVAQYIEEPISNLIIDNHLTANQAIVIDKDSSGITINHY